MRSADRVGDVADQTQDGADPEVVRGAMLLVVTDDGKLLLHLRDDKPGVIHRGRWAGFGGAIEGDETPEEAVRREMLEETGVEILEPRRLTEEVDAEGEGHHVTLFYVVGGITPEDIHLQEGAGVGVHSLADLDQLDVTPFIRRAIDAHLRPILVG